MTEILVVDDEIEICQAMEKFLISEGYSVRIAVSGEEAVSKVKKSPPDVVLLDVAMPGKDGIETYREIAFLYDDIAVVMLAGADDIDAVLMGVNMGDIAFLGKPIVFDEVKRSISSALAKKLQKAENQKYQDDLERMVTEKTIQLIEAEDRLKVITNSANDAIIMIDSDGRVTFWNPAAQRIYGYSADEMMGKKLSDYIIPEAYRQKHDKGIESFRNDGKGSAIGKTLELSAVRKNGEEFPIELSLSAVKVQEKWHAVGLTRDITTRQKAQEKLRLNQEWLSRIVETITEGLYIVDASGQIVFANKASEKLFGMKREELYKRTYHDPKWTVTKLDGEPLKEEDYPFVKVKTSGKPVYGVELVVPRHDGAELIVSINAAPMYGSDGAFQGMVATQEDVTEKKLAERALIDAIRDNEQLLAALPSIMIRLGKDRRILKWDLMAEKAFNLDASMVVGSLFYDQNIRWKWEKVKNAIDKCEETGQTVELNDIKYTRADGKEGFITFTVTPIGNEAGEVEEFLLLGSDVTEHKILESQLTQAQKLESIGSLAAGIAHEINTPTQFVGDNMHFLDSAFKDIETLIQKYSEVNDEFRRKGGDSALTEGIAKTIGEIDFDFLIDEIPKAIQSSLKGIERVTAIIRAMRDFSHPGSKEKELIDINNSIESTVTVSRNEWKYVAEMEMDFDPSLTMVPCYQGEFNQVILNLVTNAAYAIGEVIGEGPEEKGSITIKTRKEEDWAVITIADTGGGVPDSIKDKLFDHFFTTKDVGRGTGQGLSISRAIIVEKHGGRISFDSEEGKGSTFTIKIPLDVK